MSYLLSCLRGLAVLCLPLTLSAQFGALHNISLATGNKYSLTYGDLNGDTQPDLVVGADNGVYWIPNAGDGTGFKAPRIVSQEGGWAAIGDLDQDGDLDLVCTRNTTSDLAWYRNDGQGGFNLAATWGAPHQNFVKLELADMDSDGDLDVLALDTWNASDIIWYKNLDGAGTLSAAVPTITDQGSLIKPLDVDSDGDMDIVYAKIDRVKWAENTNGLGTAWGAPKELDDNEAASAAAIADIDGDGLKDLVMTLFGSGLVWFKRTPTGFTPLNYLLPGVVSKTGYDQFFCVGDPDQDGDTDVVGSSPGKLIFYRNNGTGTFQHTIIDSQSNINGLVFTDLDGDGDEDLAATNRDAEKVLWYANDGGAVFGQARLISADYNYLGDLTLADLDLDGDPDLITANGNSGSIDSVVRQLLWYENQGGHFTRQHVLAFDWADFSRVQVADFDGDNDPDILAASAKPFNISWFENDGMGRFDVVHTLASSVGGGVPPEILATDVDADGDPDVVFATIGGFGKVSWFQNLDGAGTFSPVKSIANASYVDQIVFADVNGDQAPDLICSHHSGSDYLWVGYADSAGYFSKPVTNYAKANLGEDLKTGDLDGDGKTDLITIGEGGLYVLLSSKNFNNKIVESVFLYNGRSVSVSDIDLDGDNDLVVTKGEYTDGYILWYENKDGLGNFNPSSTILSGIVDYNGLPNLVCGDLDADQDPDIIFSNGYLYQQIDWIENVLVGSRTISGRCFWDVNASGQPESNEAGLQQLPIKISPLPRSVYTNADGDFRFYVQPGNFEVTFEPNLCQKLTTPATLQAITTDASVDSLFFGVQHDPDSSGLRGWLVSTPTRCDNRAEFRLVLENTGCVAESGTVTVHTNDLADFYTGFPAPQTVSGDSMTWDFQDIPPGNRYEIRVLFDIAGADHLGEMVQMRVSPRTTTGGVVIAREMFDYVSAITCAYDPNDKQVWPARGADNRVNDGEELLYTIRFQNTGTDTAFRVVIHDRLSPDLDWATLRPLAASHPFTSSLSENGLLEFRFENILLPDSATNQAGSQGFVSFLVHLRAGLPLNTVIGNTADIYFDLNPPITTNTVQVRRYDGTSALDAPAETGHSIRFYPNPFSENLYFQWNDSRDASPVRLELWDMTQRFIREVRLPDGERGALEIPGLESGLYLYRIVRVGDQVVLGSGKLVRL